MSSSLAGGRPDAVATHPSSSIKSSCTRASCSLARRQATTTFQLALMRCVRRACQRNVTALAAAGEAAAVVALATDDKMLLLASSGSITAACFQKALSVRLDALQSTGGSEVSLETGAAAVSSVRC